MLEDFIINGFACIGMLAVLFFVLFLITEMSNALKKRQILKRERTKWRGMAQRYIEQR